MRCMNAPPPPSPGCAHHLPLLRRRLRRAGDARRPRRRDDRRRSRPSGESRAAVLKGLRAWRDAVARGPPAASDAAAGRRTLARTAWDRRSSTVAGGLRAIIERDGPDAVAFYLSGQLLTEDYYVANKLMKGFIGSANVDTNSRLCMASSVAGHRRAFGADIVPGTYEDIDEADLVVLVGSNAAWCHPVLYQRMIANKRERGAKIVVIDPRRTATADDADLFLPIAPGMDTALFCGLLRASRRHGALDFALHRRAHGGFRRGARACTRNRAGRRRDRARRPACDRRRCDVSSTVPRRPSVSSPASRRA